MLMNEIYSGLWMGSEPIAPTQYYDEFDTIVYAASGIKPNYKKFPEKSLLYVPLLDLRGEKLEAGTFEKAEQMAIWVAKDIKAGKQVLVTCAAGINRSGLIVALALRLLTGWPGIKCVEEVRNKRVFALTNEDFVHFISSLLSREPLSLTT